MESFAGHIFETVDSADMRKAINAAYGALFEGLNPMQKTRRALRTILPVPPGGWDAPALDGQGNEMRTVENGRTMNYAECLEYGIRNMFFHDGGRTAPKFEPGVARIAYTELGIWPQGLADWRGGERKPDWAKARELVKILKNITISHVEDYDFDLNGMTFAELSERFAHGTSDSGVVNEDADNTGCQYNVTWIPNFDEARKWAQYTRKTQTWCLTTDKSQWNRYMKGNTVKMYICTRPGFEKVPGEPGPNCPLDEYGLSMLGVTVNPDGSLDTCCSRWNHLHGGSDMVMDEAQLCKVLNVRKLSDVCPPYTETELESHGKAVFDKAVELSRHVGETVDGIYVTTVGNVNLPGIRMLAFIDSETEHEMYFLLKDDGTPVLKFPVFNYRVFGSGERGTTLVARYMPDASTLGELMEVVDEDGDCADSEDDYPYVFYSAVTGKAQLMDGDRSISECDVNEALESQDPEYTYDYKPEELNRGIALTVHAAFEGLYLFDTVKMDFVDSLSDGYIDSHTGNLLMKDGILYFVSPKGIVDYAKELNDGKEYDGVEMFSTKSQYNIAVEVWMYNRNRDLQRDAPRYAPHIVAIVNPITGKILKKFSGVIEADMYGDDKGVELTFENGSGMVVDFEGNPIIS